MSGGDNLSRKSEVSTKVLNALLSKVAIRMLPAISEADVPTRVEGLHEVEYFEVGASLNMWVSGRHRILLDDEDSLTEEVGEDGDAVGFGDEHDG